MTALTIWEDARRAIAQARTIDEIKDIRDRAEALRLYAKQAGETLEVQNAVAEIKLRAERRAGEILKEIEKNEGGRPTENPYHDGRGFEPTLAELGITHNQSSRWQKIAGISDPAFEAQIAQTKAAGEELTTVSMLQLAADPDGRHKPKTNRGGGETVAQSIDNCQTPPYALDPLLPYLNPDMKIWEPACGEGLLAEALYDSGFSEDRVIATDIKTGRNFFDYEPPGWDCLVTNPPYSIKYTWLERCYALYKPFALLLPVETIGAKQAQESMKRYGFEIMLLDQRVDFRMPTKGWNGSAQFPVFWLCWQLLPAQVMFGSIEAGKKEFIHGR